MATVLVGVDGSAESGAALVWAADEARLRMAELQVVYVYEHTPAWQMYGYGLEAPMAVTTEATSGRLRMTRQPPSRGHADWSRT